jgi:hypothetical protein
MTIKVPLAVSGQQPGTTGKLSWRVGQATRWNVPYRWIDFSAICFSMLVHAIVAEIHI